MIKALVEEVNFNLHFCWDAAGECSDCTDDVSLYWSSKVVIVSKGGIERDMSVFYGVLCATKKLYGIDMFGSSYGI